MREQPPPAAWPAAGNAPVFSLVYSGLFYFLGSNQGLTYDAISLCPQPSLLICILYLQIPQSLLLVVCFG